MTRPILSAAATLAAAGALASCAQTGGEPEPIAGVSTERQCFFVRQVNGYSEAPDGPNGEERLTVSTGPNDDWLLETFGACPDLDWSYNIAIDNRFAGSNLCTGETTTIIVPRTASGVPDRCMARVLGKLLEE
jgi:hypothetical protein